MSGEHAQSVINSERSHQLYSQLTAEYGRQSPQHQGLTAAEFQTALDDEQVAKTIVEHDGDMLALPQLGPVDRSEWLNAGYYAGRYPEETRVGNVLHYVDIPGVEPGPDVLTRLGEVAAGDGVVVFDFPTTDTEYPDRVKRMLADAGIEVAEDVLLGHQTYFAGQLVLKHEVQPSDPVLDMNQAFAATIASGEFDPTKTANGPSMQAKVDVDQAREMQRFYDDAYEFISDHPCNQGLDPDEFLRMATEKEWITKVVNTVDGQVQSILLLDNELGELSWVNEAYYEENYPDKAATKQIVWFPGLAARPDKKVGRNLQTMVDYATNLLAKGNNDILVVFDCCDKNSGFLPDVLNTMINATGVAGIDIQQIAAQQYRALRLKTKQ